MMGSGYRDKHFIISRQRRVWDSDEQREEVGSCLCIWVFGFLGLTEWEGVRLV